MGDEKIRKDLLYFLNAHIGCSIAPAFCTRDIIKWIAWLENTGEQKAAWSEEDDKNLEKTIWYVEKGGKLIFMKTDKLVSWLKSLKDRCLPQPKHEWSEEDEAMIKVAIAVLNRYSHKDVADWLKSLRPQKIIKLPHWKKCTLPDTPWGAK